MDASVSFLLKNLTEVASDNTKLISQAEINVQSLIGELNQLQGFLRDASEKRIQSEAVKELVKSIRRATFAAEDAIDSYMIEAANHKRRNMAWRMFNLGPHVVKLRNTAAQINISLSQVKEYLNRQSILGDSERKDHGAAVEATNKRPPVVEEDDVVGFDEQAAELINRLNGGTTDLQIITIVGLGGLGKTTLTKKVWNDPNIQHEFSTCCWVYVSQVYDPKELYLSILKQVNKNVSSYIMSLNEEELVEEVRKTLIWKYLIVLDDVWMGKDWNNVKKAFPDKKKGSRIVITSRNTEVAYYADRESKPHELQFLTDEHSLELLRIKIFGRQGDFPEDLKGIALRIARKCYGLPLAIVVIAGVLQLNINKVHWETVAKSVNAFISMKAEQCMDVLALSYHNLPYHLRDCFLYFGVFRVSHHIPARVLIRLWMAEGLIQKLGDIDVSLAGELELEEIANDHLEEFARRNLMIVVSRSSTGQIKTCRVHDMLRELCVKEAALQNFFHKLQSHSPTSSSLSSSPETDHYRRLCIHSDILQYIHLKPSAKLSRSFLCFSAEEANILKRNLSYIPDAFKLARVLHLDTILFPDYPGKLCQLVLLRYLAISGNFSSIPQALSNFINLQSLIVKSTTASHTIEVKADIFSLSQLRHFRTNVAAQLCKPKARENPVRSNLQTLSLIKPESCTEEVLGKTPYLKKLGIRGKLGLIVEDKGGSGFDVLIKLKHLERLKLLNDVHPHPQSEGRLSSLPPPSKFPQTLKKLTISETMLHWWHMSVLGLLPKLEVLKLKDNAFMGDTWDTTTHGFLSLKVLHIGKTDLAFWNGSAPDHFPVLETIVLEQCKSLFRFPSGLGDARSTVKIMDLSHCSTSAVDSAYKIKADRDKAVDSAYKIKADRDKADKIKADRDKAVDSAYKINPLKLVVFPPKN